MQTGCVGLQWNGVGVWAGICGVILYVALIREEWGGSEEDNNMNDISEEKRH